MIDKTNTGTCVIKTCEEKKVSKGFCSAHYARNYARTMGKIKNVDMMAPLINKGLTGCSIPDCDRNHYRKSLCLFHCRQVKNNIKID